MLWFLLVPAVIVGTLKKFAYGKDRRIPRSVGWALAMMAGVVTCDISAGAAALTGFLLQQHPVKTSEEVLTALKDKNAVSAKYFLGTGSSDGEQYYIYSRQLTDGVIQSNRVYATDGVHVYEEPRADARLVKLGMEFDHPWASMIALHVGGSKSYEFHIPAGTLRHDYAMQ